MVIVCHLPIVQYFGTLSSKDLLPQGLTEAVRQNGAERKDRGGWRWSSGVFGCAVRCFPGQGGRNL